MTAIYKAFNYYFAVKPETNLYFRKIFGDTHLYYILNGKTRLPKHIGQEHMDILCGDQVTERLGYMFFAHVMDHQVKNVLLEDCKSCFAFSTPAGMDYHYIKEEPINFSFEFSIDDMIKDSSIKNFYQLYNTQWRHIMDINPDTFYLRDEKQMMVGSKDWKRVERWLG